MSPPDSSTHAHSNALKIYVGIFVALTIVTIVECLPLFGLWDIPAPVLIVLSVCKFLVVCYFFMHLLGDHPIFKRLFFIPLAMATVSFMVIMTLQDSWTLAYQHTERGSDTDAIAARYRGVWDGPCNAWVKSPFTGNEYCASPSVGFTTAAAYEALKPSSAADPRFEGFDAKSPDEKKAILMAVGEEVYGGKCAACHQATGQGLAGTFPPLAGDPVANGSAEEHITIVLKGMSGKPINGVNYAAAMPAHAGLLNDDQVAAVLTFERSSWGNTGSVVEPSAVKSAR